MRETLLLDGELVREARRMSGITELSAVLHAGLHALIERESALRLARLGGSEPELRPASRRRYTRP